MWGEVTRQLALWPWLPVLNTGSEGRGGEGEGGEGEGGRGKGGGKTFTKKAFSVWGLTRCVSVGSHPNSPLCVVCSVYVCSVYV